MLDFDDLDEAEAERDAEAQAEAEVRAAEEAAARAAAEAKEAERRAEEAAQAAARAREAEAEAARAPVRRPPPWKNVQQPKIEFMQMADVASKNIPGDYYGIRFPHDQEQILKMGPAWLTEAFHTSGVLPKDNAVTKIAEAKEFVGGGAGLKCILKVEYKEDRPYLHKNLFVKLPHKPGGNDRFFVSCMWNHDRPETIFNIWLEQTVPYRVPKCYFADICAQTTNFILITEALDWAPKGTRDFKPGDIEPAYDKYMDWELPDGGPMYYRACCKAIGKIAAYHKAGKLHPQVNEMFPMPAPVPEIPKGLPGLEATAKKEATYKIDSLIRFLSQTAKGAFPTEVTDETWLQQWKGEALHYMDFLTEVGCFYMGAGTSSPSDYVGLTHNNLQIDNAFFWHDGGNEMQVGLLDWGILACGSLIGAAHGCITGAELEVLLKHREEFLETIVSSYASNGGPRLDLERFKQMSDLSLMGWACSITANVTQVLKHTKPKEWAEIKDWSDERLTGRFQTRAHCSQFKIALQIWRRLDLYNIFQAWLKQQGLPATK